MNIDIKNVSQSKGFRRIVIIVGVLLVVLVSFSAGVNVGLRKARFSYAFGENYERNFGGGFQMSDRWMNRMKSGHGFKMPFFDGEEKGYRNGHGVVGEVLSITENSAVIKDMFGNESSVLVNDTTILKNGRETIEFSALKIGDRIAIIGKPNEDGVIEARFIRILTNLSGK